MPRRDPIPNDALFSPNAARRIGGRIGRANLQGGRVGVGHHQNQLSPGKIDVRVSQIYRFLNADGTGDGSDCPSLERFMRTGDLGGFRIYDPAAMNWYHDADREDAESRAELAQWLSLRSIFRGAWGLDLFYIGLYMVTLIAVIALLAIQILGAGS